MERRSRTSSTQIATHPEAGYQTSHTGFSDRLAAAQKPRISSTPPTVYRSFVSLTISWILQIGVVLSAAIIIVGLFLLLGQGGALDAQQLQTFPHTLDQVWSGLRVLQPQAIIELGLLLLIATPVLRVMISVVAFNMEHDRRYVVIALLLLAILMTSFMLGKGGA
jgi:uncharacterized membrane protein